MSGMRVRPHYDHIPLHRLWAFTLFQTDLTQVEDTHILECEACCVLMLACVKARRFVKVLKEDAANAPRLARAS
jgi:hypothetical protein